MLVVLLSVVMVIGGLVERSHVLEDDETSEGNGVSKVLEWCDDRVEQEH